MVTVKRLQGPLDKANGPWSAEARPADAGAFAAPEGNPGMPKDAVDWWRERSGARPAKL